MPGLLIILLAGALGAAEPAATTPAAPAKAKSDLICTYQAEKDSHFKKRVCMTKAERDARSAYERENLQNKQRTFCTGANC